MINQVYRNIKTGNLYYVTAEATNCTNKDNNARMVVYREFGLDHKTILLRYFVREYSEFLDKFELFIDEDNDGTD